MLSEKMYSFVLFSTICYDIDIFKIKIYLKIHTNLKFGEPKSI